MNKPGPLNLNTIILTIVLGVSSWTLNRVIALGEAYSAITERDVSQEREMVCVRARLALVESENRNLALKLAAIK